MIVSEFEILKVIGLMGKVIPTARILHIDTAAVPTTDSATALGRSDRYTDIVGGRHVRVDDLRRRFVAGDYAVAPTEIADKMLGRAICDQMAKLYDA